MSHACLYKYYCSISKLQIKLTMSTASNSAAQIWANSSTLVELQQVAKDNNIALPPKAKKIEIVELLMRNNVSRSCKRKAPMDTIRVKRSCLTPPKSSSVKKVSRQRLHDMVHNIKTQMGEPLQLVATRQNGMHTIGDLVVQNAQVVGKFKDGYVVNLGTGDVQNAIDSRLDFNLLSFVPHGNLSAVNPQANEEPMYNEESDDSIDDDN